MTAATGAPTKIGSLLRKGLIDTALQAVATTGVRFALIASIPVLAVFLPPEDIARFDLFVIAANILMIFMTFGLDSALAVVVSTRSERRRAALFWSAMAGVGGLTLVLFWPLQAAFGHFSFGGALEEGDFLRAYIYAFANALMLVIFSYFRWLGKAGLASVLVIVGNGIGLVVAYAVLILTGSMAGFMFGLIAGVLIGAMLCLGQAFLRLPISVHLVRPAYLGVLMLHLMRVGWPYGAASLLLLCRRAVDRGILLMLGSAVVLGSYAVVARSGELLAFALAIPSIGLSPVILRHAGEESGRRLARWLYLAYMGSALLCAAGASAAWVILGAAMFPDSARLIAPLFLSVVVGSVILTQTSVTGYGFIIVKNTKLVAYLSMLFIVSYMAIAAPFVAMGDLARAVGVGFVGASLIYVTVFVWLSERRYSFGYPLRLITALNVGMGAVSLVPLFVY